MKNVSIIGASGYTGKELIKFLLRHPMVQITHITSDNNAGKKLGDLHPELRGKSELVFEAYDWAKIKQDTDIVFLALPHATAMNFAAEAIADGKIVIDLSADFRIKNADVYEKWYKTKHLHLDLLAEAIFGLPEICRDKIKNARLIANPGCYATSMILPLYPLLKENLIDAENIIVDSKSGVSGAGKKLDNMYLYNEQNENFLPYNPGKHRHIPEVVEVLNFTSGKEINLTFVPHLTPMTRGIVSTIYTTPTKKLNYSDIKNVYEKYYGKEYFVRILPEGIYPSAKGVAYSNFCDIGFTYLEESNKLVVVSALDNLVKGASGQAVQNMNVILGLDEKISLE